MRITKLLRSATEKAAFTRKPSGAPPGTLIYTGRREMEKVQIHLTTYTQDVFKTSEGEDALPIRDTAGTTWYDLRGLHNIGLIEEVGKTFGIHPLALEDILDVQQRPKMEGYPDGVLLLLKAFHYDKETRALSIEQVSVYLYDGGVITFQEDPGDLFGSIRKRLETSSGRIRTRGADYLAYALIDNIVDRYFNVLDKIEESLDELEDTIMKKPEPATKSRIHELRLSLLSMRKSVSPLREMVGSFSTDEHRLITDDTQLFVRDLKDHVIQITDLVETYRDVTNGLYDLYVSEISFRMNAVMQTLTIVSTIFIPLSFLAGVFGMNFVHMPGMDYEYAYHIFWAVMLLITGLMLYWFRRRKWL